VHWDLQESKNGSIKSPGAHPETHVWLISFRIRSIKVVFEQEVEHILFQGSA
jgi:hypothetical protein